MTTGMRRYSDDSDPGTLLASFGEARLVQPLAGNTHAHGQEYW